MEQNQFRRAKARRCGERATRLRRQCRSRWLAVLAVTPQQDFYKNFCTSTDGDRGAKRIEQHWFAELADAGSKDTWTQDEIEKQRCTAANGLGESSVGGH
ncbi:hypothetical protein TRVL_07301 [Trypanosoma vivax]|nr:hypothetical protein TRVL_07301 [Trypanosoma vivax]